MSSGDQSLIIYFNQNAEQVLLTTGYDAMSLEDKNSLVVVLANAAGLPYSSITTDYILAQHKTLKSAVINQNCEDAITAGFTSANGHTYNLDRDDQVNMIGQKDELMADTTITTVKWKTVDQGYIDHTRDDWLTVYGEAFTFKKTQLFHCNDLKGQITAATDHPTIIGIKWS